MSKPAREYLNSAPDHDEEKLKTLAFSDPLTGLPNERLFDHALDKRLAQARDEEEPLALLMLDLDGFKEINDTHGHPTGDRVIRQVGHRLATLTGEEMVAARIGGDEFAILCSEFDKPGELTTLAERIAETIERPTTIKNQTFHVSASIGIAIVPRDASTKKELVEQADQAMYAAKDSPFRPDWIKSSMLR